MFTCPIDQVVCDANGEVEVADILTNINQLISSCNEASTFCDKYKNADVIRVLKVGNVMYMTNDGSEPVVV